MIKIFYGKNSCINFFVAAFVLAAFSSPALATNAQFTTTDPSRIQEQQSVTPMESDPSGNVELQDSSRPELVNAPQGAESFTFTLSNLSIEGVTAYTQEEFASLYASEVGKEISVARIYEIANAITKKYHADGYIFSRAVVPEQEIEGGAVKIAVIEGYADDVHVTSDLPSSYLTDGIVDAVKSSRPLNIRALERAMLLMNMLPGRDAQAILEPISREDAPTGAIDLNIAIREKGPRFSVGVDNYGSRYIGPWQMSGVAVIPHNFLYTGETTIAASLAQPLDELVYGFISEKIPLTSDGLTMTFSAQANKSEPGSRLESLEIKNKFRSFKLEFKYPLYLTRAERITPRISFESNDSQSDLLGDRFYHDRLSVLRVGVNHKFADRLNGTNDLDFTLSQGLNILGVRETGSDDLSRAEGKTDFTKLRLEAQRIQRFGAAPFSLKANVTGQYAFSELLSSEEMGYGGPNYGRAFDNSEITGDRGVKAVFELAHDPLKISPDILMQPYIFYDIAKVWNLDTGAGSMSGASAGFGVRTQLYDRFYLNTAVAQPLTRSQSNPLYGNGRNPRFMLSLQYTY